jgi:hypothetical protein
MILSYDKNNNKPLFNVKGIGNILKNALSKKSVEKDVSDAFSKMDLNLNFFDQLTDPKLNIANE